MRTVERLKNLSDKKTYLKPCPICGSGPKLHTHTYDPWRDGGGTVTTVTDYRYECEGCGIIKSGRFNTLDNMIDCEKEAEEDWNEVVDYLKTRIKNEE